MTSRRRCILLTTTCLCIGLGQGSAGLAQETLPQEGFLGTLTLGESKRAVQTETATPTTVIDEEKIGDR